MNRACTVRPFAYSVSTRSTMPECELPWLVAGLPVYYHRSNGDRVSLALLQEVGVASLFGTNWVVKRSCTSMHPRSGWSLQLGLLRAPIPPNMCTMRRRWTLRWSPNYLKWKLKPLKLMIMTQKPPDLKMIVHTMRHLWTFKCPPPPLTCSGSGSPPPVMHMSPVADEIEIPVAQPVLSPMLSPVHDLLRRCVQGAEIGSLEPVTNIRFKRENSQYANRGCRVQKIGPWNL